MKLQLLSDHTSDQVRKAAAQRQAEFERATLQHERKLRDLQAERDSNRTKLSVAWRERRVFGVLYWMLVVLFDLFSSTPAPPQIAEPSRDELVWMSGNAGEEGVNEHLSSFLSDDWTLLTGYHNPKGEIDQILVGPVGVFAIEINNINGCVYCNGDRWMRDKYDSYGNLVETNLPITDKRGRSPSKQLNDSANLLQAFLEKRTGVARVSRVVVLAHASSEIGDVRNPTVDVVATTQQLNQRLLSSASTIRLDRITIERVVSAIKKDHDFYNSARQGAPGTQDKTA
jgi:hypothetical protein